MVEYQGLSLPKKLLNYIDEAIKNAPYMTKNEFIRQAIRHEIERAKNNE